MEHWWNNTDRRTFNCWEQILIQCHSVHQNYLHGLACDRTQAPTATGRMSELWPVSVASHSMLNIRLRGDTGTALPHHTCKNKSKHAYSCSLLYQITSSYRYHFRFIPLRDNTTAYMHVVCVITYQRDGIAIHLIDLITVIVHSGRFILFL